MRTGGKTGGIAVAIATASLIVLAGCGGGSGSEGAESSSASGAEDPEQTTSATPSPSPTPASIRDTDFGEVTWTFDYEGEWLEIELAGGEGEGEVYGSPAVYTVGEPVYADADLDGIEDAVVPLTQEAGNGVQTTWYVWLGPTEVDAEPVQLPLPVASQARCGDAVDSVTAVDGGIRIEERMRSVMAGDCASDPDVERTRDVVVVGDGSAEGSWPALADGSGWGGYCPLIELSEGVEGPVEGRVGPADAAPESSHAGEQELFGYLGYYPFRQPDGWRVIAFADEDGPEMSAICTWVLA